MGCVFDALCLLILLFGLLFGIGGALSPTGQATVRGLAAYDVRQLGFGPAPAAVSQAPAQPYPAMPGCTQVGWNGAAPVYEGDGCK